MARIAQRRFAISDLSVSGVGLVGNACALQVGSRVRVTLSTAFAANVELAADIRRIDEGSFGLAWAPHENLAALQRVYHLLDMATRQRVAT